MSNSDKYLIETYSSLFDGLNPLTKIALIERLTKSLKKDAKHKTNNFLKSFGAFASEKSAEVIIEEIKESRKFRNREITF